MSHLTAFMVHEALGAQSPADWLPWTFRTTLERLDFVYAAQNTQAA